MSAPPVVTPRPDEDVAEVDRDVVATISVDRVIEWVSDSVVDLLGWHGDEIVGADLAQLVDFAQSPLDLWDVTGLRDGQSVTRSCVFLHRDQSTSTGRITLHPVVVEGTWTSTIATLSPSDDPRRRAGVDWYQLLAENVSDVVSLTYGDGDIAWVSPSVTSLVGLAADDVIGHRFREFVLASDLTIVDDAVTRIRRGDSVTFSVRLRHRDESVRWVSISSHLVAVPGFDDARVAVWRDITTETESRQALVRSQHDFQRVAENASDVVVQTDVEGRIEWVSPSLTSVLGWRSADVAGKHIAELASTSDVDRATAWQALVLAGEKVRSAQLRLRTATSGSRWVALRAQPLVDNRQTRGIIMSLRDCHGEVVARRALDTLSASSRALTRSDDEDELLTAMCNAAVNEGGYLLCWYARPLDNDATGFASVASSPADFGGDHQGAMHGVDGRETPERVAWRTGQTVIVNDRRGDTRFTPSVPENKARAFRATIALPVRCARVLDGILVVEAPEVGSFDATVARVFEDLAAQIGFGLQRLRDRDQLLKSLAEQRLLSGAVTQAGESIVITDVAASVIYANPAAEASTGYSLAELLGKNPRVFQSGVQNRAFYEAMWQQLTSGLTWRGVLVNRRKNGGLYEEEATISPIHDDDGRITAYVAVKRDLSVERRLQADLFNDGQDRTVVLQIMREMRPMESFDAMAHMLCRLVTHLEGIDAAMFKVLHADGTMSIVGQYFDPSASDVITKIPDTVLSEQFHVGQSAATLDLSSERWSEHADVWAAIEGTGLQGAVVVPLRWNDESLGALVLATHDKDRAVDLPRRLGAFDQLGSYAGSYFGGHLETQRRLEMVRDEVRDVIENKAFTPVFQPFVELATGRIVGYEALTRFKNGRRPDEFIMAAHRAGLGPELEVACAQAQLEAARGLDPSLWISLNFSPTAIVHHYVEPVVATTTRTIVLEITEHDPINNDNDVENYAAIRKVIGALPHCRVAVDDAGAGFATFNHILELRPDYIKLDIYLIRDIDSKPDRQAMAAGMMKYASLMNIVVIAEGVETQAEAEALERLASPSEHLSPLLVQGYHFGRPAPL